MSLDRSQVDKKDKWNVEVLYPSLQDWEQAYQQVVSSNHAPRWPHLEEFKGNLGDPETLRKALDFFLDLSRNLSKLYTYAHLKHDEELTQDEYKVAYNKILAALHDFSHETAWFEPELLSLNDENLTHLIHSNLLSPYKFHIEKIIRIRKHTLPSEGEALLALANKALQANYQAFKALNDADFKFGSVTDSSHCPRELTHGLYHLYLRDQDRTLRENAFKQLHQKYKDYENTLCELINGQTQAHVFNARARNYSSSLEAALFPKNIDSSVYHALIQAVNERLDVLHDYTKLRKKMMGLEELHLYDMYVPLISAVDIRLSYEEAENLVIESVAPLGIDYQNLLKKGLKEQGWVDRYENKNKRSGAYSSGCYDSFPYILMNYKSLLKDTFTLAHEAGHSMHSLLSHTHQPYHYADYPIFLAEVASTFNEDLLMKLMLERANSKEERIYLINEKIEDIRGTLFRQTMFAEFELSIHTMAEGNTPLTPKLLKDTYRELNKRYFGPHVVIDEEADSEWSRIPHFYYNFYVFQYATGISAALALSDRVLKGGSIEREEYLSFLKAGSSRYPLEILKTAGVDMHSPIPVRTAINKFEDLVRMLAQELDSSSQLFKNQGVQQIST